MPAPTKRSYVSYYFSLLLVTAIVFLVVTQLAAWQRAQLVAELADRVAHRDAAEATAALRHLAAMPRPPVDVLVAAAASTDRAVAIESRYLINDLLRRWRRQVDSRRRVGTVARQLADLADALTRRQQAFSPSDYRWVRNTAGRILRLANRIPGKKSPLVAAQCDTLLASLTTAEMSAAAFIGRNGAAPSQVVTPIPRMVAGVSEAHSGDPRVASGISEVAGASPVDVPPATQESPEASDSPDLSVPRIDAENQTSRPLRWLHPMLRSVPAQPLTTPPSASDLEPRAARTDSTSSPADESPANSPLERASARELLARWLDADGSEVFPLEEELTRRGFGRLSARLVEPLFSADAEERLRLVDDVLTAPGVDARPWLLLLAEDADADVRFLAVTIMATSDDRGLIDKAWNVAIRDRDPRIAGLAGRLRERRESTR